jgi:hypothetical protein
MIMLAAHPGAAAAGMDIGRFDRKFMLLVCVVGCRSIVIVVRVMAVGIRFQCE